jgi:hypothetical protein
VNRRSEGGPVMVDVELYVSKKRYDVNWTNLDRDSLGGGT